MRRLTGPSSQYSLGRHSRPARHGAGQTGCRSRRVGSSPRYALRQPRRRGGSFHQLGRSGWNGRSKCGAVGMPGRRCRDRGSRPASRVVQRRSPGTRQRRCIWDI